MSDNVQISVGSGPSIAADEVTIGGNTVLVQRVKLGFGADNSYTEVSGVGSGALPVQSDGVGAPSDNTYTGTGNMSLVAGVKKLVALFTAGFTMSGSVSMADNEGMKGAMGGVCANPTATITRPADTTAYAINDLVANSTTAASVNMGSIAAARVAQGSFQVDRMRLTTNHTTGLAGINFRVRLWTAAPTYTNGDNGAYAVATGAAGYLGSFTGAFEQFADGASALLLPDSGSPCVDLASGQAIFWDMQTLAAFTPQSGKTFTITPEVKQD